MKLILASLAILSQAAVSIGSRDAPVTFQVSLQTLTNQHICVGSIIDKNSIITGASCVSEEHPDKLKIVACTEDLKDPKETYLVSEIIVHEGWNGSSAINDIAIIKVKTPFKLSESSFALLPKSGQDIDAGSIGAVYAYRGLPEGDKGPKKLESADVKIVDQSTCEEHYTALGKLRIFPTQFCAQHVVLGGGSHQGDGGGPLILDGKLFGLVSWSLGSEDNKYPSVYTRVPAYIDWINKHAI